MKLASKQPSWNHTSHTPTYPLQVCHRGKAAHSSRKDICPPQAIDEAINRRNTDSRTSSYYAEAQTPPCPIHLLLTNSSDNSSQLSISFLITHSDCTCVKTRAFLSPSFAFSHFPSKQRPCLTSCVNTFQQAGHCTVHSPGRP